MILNKKVLLKCVKNQNNTKNVLQKKEILKEVDKNPNLIDTLSYKRLK